jgi:curved DNA-binding protein CbpA
VNQDKIDFYEVLQVSPNADFDTIERVFRHLAKKLHPDNPTTGNADKFNVLLEAYTALVDPEKRAAYDAGYENLRKTAWMADPGEKTDSVGIDQAIRTDILHLLYLTRRRNPREAGLGFWQMHNTLGCPEEHLTFHTWYLKEKGWIKVDENGKYEISAGGVDMVENAGNGAKLITYKNE